MEKQLLTCLIRDDFSSLILLYRKILSSDYDLVAINTAYDRKNQKFVLDQNVVSSFPRFAYLGPTPIYEDYVTMANFPIWINLNDYKENILNIDIMEHLKEFHLNDIFPHQQTQYIHKISVREPEFKEGQIKINSDNDAINICLNIFDPLYDKDLVLQYDITYILGKIQQTFKKKINIWIVGIINEAHTAKINEIISDVLASYNFNIINATPESLSYQIGVLLNSHLLISGPYGLGFLAYTMKIPTFVVYPFIMYNIKGKTIDPTRNNLSYIETTDEDVYADLDKIMSLIDKELQVQNDRNRNCNL